MKLRSLAIVCSGLLAAVTLSSSLSSCSSVERDAIRVDGANISMSRFEEILAGIPASGPLVGKTVGVQTARNIALSEIQILLYGDLLQAQGNAVTDADRDAARQANATAIADFEKLPKVVQDFANESKAIGTILDTHPVPDETVTSKIRSARIWVDPSIGMWDPQQGVVALGTPIVPFDTTPADGSAAPPTSQP